MQEDKTLECMTLQQYIDMYKQPLSENSWEVILKKKNKEKKDKKKKKQSPILNEKVKKLKEKKAPEGAAP
jgi:hypothetical protein